MLLGLSSSGSSQELVEGSARYLLLLVQGAKRALQLATHPSFAKARPRSGMGTSEAGTTGVCSSCAKEPGHDVEPGGDTASGGGATATGGGGGGGGGLPGGRDAGAVHAQAESQPFFPQPLPIIPEHQREGLPLLRYSQDYLDVSQRAYLIALQVGAWAGQGRGGTKQGEQPAHSACPSGPPTHYSLAHPDYTLITMLVEL